MAHSSIYIMLDILDSRNEQILLLWHLTRLRLLNRAVLMLTHEFSLAHIFRKLVHSLEECSIFEF